MKYRTYKNTDLRVSEVGFGLWTVSTGWWGQFTDGEAVELMRNAFDKGITLFDAADTYGDGRSEELISKAFEGCRDEIVVATKIGYLFEDDKERRGQRERAKDFGAVHLRKATENALRRLRTDRIDLMQLHNIEMETIASDETWDTMEALKREGKICHYGMALGPAIGWLYEGRRCIERRGITSVQHIYNMLEQHPGAKIQSAADEHNRDTMFLIRVTHSSGMLEGHYTEDTTFPPTDHRSHRPKSWLINGLKKIETLRFLQSPERTLGQAALLWLLADARVASTLPNIYNREQLREFAMAPECPPLSEDEMARIATLAADNFGVDEPPSKYKGTME